MKRNKKAKRSVGLFQVFAIILASFGTAFLITSNLVYAASLNNGIDGLTTSYTNGSWTTSGTTFIGTATGEAAGTCSSASNVTSTLTFTNSKSNASVLYFDYDKPVYNSSQSGSVSIDGNQVTAAGSFQKIVAASGTVNVVLYTGNAGAYTAGLTIRNVVLVDSTKTIDVTCKSTTNGSYTVKYGDTTTSSISSTPQTINSLPSSTKFTFTASPASGFKLACWYISDKYLNSATTTSYFSENSFSIEPIFVSSSLPVFLSNNKTTCYTDLNTANQNVGADNKVILIVSGTISAGTYSISSGKTLLIPYDAVFTEYTGGTDSHFGGAATPTAYVTLTIANDVSITINGKFFKRIASLMEFNPP